MPQQKLTELLQFLDCWEAGQAGARTQSSMAPYTPIRESFAFTDANAAKALMKALNEAAGNSFFSVEPKGRSSHVIVIAQNDIPRLESHLVGNDPAKKKLAEIAKSSPELDPVGYEPGMFSKLFGGRKSKEKLESDKRGAELNYRSNTGEKYPEKAQKTQKAAAPVPAAATPTPTTAAKPKLNKGEKAEQQRADKIRRWDDPSTGSPGKIESLMGRTSHIKKDGFIIDPWSRALIKHMKEKYPRRADCIDKAAKEFGEAQHEWNNRHSLLNPWKYTGQPFFGHNPELNPVGNIIQRAEQLYQEEKRDKLPLFPNGARGKDQKLVKSMSLEARTALKDILEEMGFEDIDYLRNTKQKTAALDVMGAVMIAAAKAKHPITSKSTVGEIRMVLEQVDQGLKEKVGRRKGKGITEEMLYSSGRDAKDGVRSGEGRRGPSQTIVDVSKEFFSVEKKVRGKKVSIVDKGAQNLLKEYLNEKGVTDQDAVKEIIIAVGKVVLRKEKETGSDTHPTVGQVIKAVKGSSTFTDLIERKAQEEARSTGRT